MDKKHHSAVFGVLIVGIVLVALILAWNTTKPSVSAEDKNKLSVSGNAELTVDPDQAEIYVVVQTLNDEAAKAKDENTRITNNVLTALKNEGVDEENIETDRFYLRQKEEYNGLTRKMEFKGYEAVHVLKVTTTELDEVGNLIDAAVDSGANGLERVTFGLTREKEKDVSSQALMKASALAKEKAETLAATVGVRLVEVIQISESSFSFVPYQYYPRAGAVMEAEEAVSISPEKVELRASVQLVFEIR